MAAVCLVCVWAEAAGDMRCGTSALAKSLTESRPLSIYQIPFGDGPNECSVSRALWPCSAIFVLWLLLSLRQASFLSWMLPVRRRLVLRDAGALFLAVRCMPSGYPDMGVA